MTRYIFNPSRLRSSVKEHEQAGYAVAGQMLRDHLGGDPLAEVGRRLRSDSRFQELIDELKVASARADQAIREEL